MQLESITPLILAYNEAANLQRTLARLQWAKAVVVLDSGSTDGTQQLAASFSNVRVETRPFDNHSAQWNHGVSLCHTEWVLALDADYVLGAGFENELAQLDGSAAAYEAHFRYLVFGKPLRGSLYPPRAVLFNRTHCHYRQDGHTQLLHINGKIEQLASKIDHDDRKSLSRWLASQDNYALLEADKLLTADRASLRLQDKLRLTCWAAIPASFFFTLLVRGTLWDGWRGWHYSLQRMLAEIILALRLIEKKISR